MAGAFDATLKQLLDVCAPDWVGLLAPLVGLPPTVATDPLDPDLSSIQATVDKVFRLRPPHAGILHFEPQSSWDGEFPARLLKYSVLLEDRHGGPVYTLALLLRREADSPHLNGTLSRAFPGGRAYLRFDYAVVRVWELHADELLVSGLGVTPLALLTDDAAPRMQAVVNRFAERAARELGNTPAANLLLTCGFILAGLRYDRAVSRALFTGVQKMRESSTYQAILDEGRAEAVALGEQEAILTLLRSRFGAVPPEVEARVRAAKDPERLRNALPQILSITAASEFTL